MTMDPAWNRGSEEEQPSYLWAMLTTPLNVNLFLATLASSTFLSIPYGAPGAILPLLAFAAGEAIAAMFVPSSSTFRAKVDLKLKLKRREAAAMHLRGEIARRCTEHDPRWDIYRNLQERVRSLREMGSHRRSALSEKDLERIEDTGIDFLGLWLAELSMEERQDSVKERDVERRIAEITARIEKGAEDERSLRKARSDLEELLLRHRRLASRKSAVEAALLSLPDAVEEIYQAIITNSAAAEGGVRLTEAIERLRLEEELESSYGAEIEKLVQPAAARVIGAARQGVKP
ncbi:hypothetical protein DFR29_102231 [Tahibacter aquaticus]|uniref:Uncharacterized protein n=1 Tax=Tahibacter aquaticus TaxID=520092 RepID=A0A4R6Z712_9GAMM|nr:hypothetical protein [Tahibacter aquaticus]TDR47571.1 hypothetical protein DFR29_102231 [Tahibacter aquaticus]